MDDSEAPSFSLGLDLDHTPPRAHHSDSHPPPPPPLLLKRLRRGPPADVSSLSPIHFACDDDDDDDDDIEDFSDDEQHLHTQACPSKRNQPFCSSSKVSLNGSGVLTTHSSVNCKERKIKESSGILGSSALEMGQSGLMFPKLTTSPLRRFQLLDSDSDSDYPVNEHGNGAHMTDPCFKKPSFEPSESVSFDQSRKASFMSDQNQDLWKRLSPVKSFTIPTPAFDEVCKEYFRSSKDKEVETSVSASRYESLFEPTSCQRDEQTWNSTYPPPPAHQYFFHKDPRIRQLVRSRLCNFHPLGVGKVNHQPDASHIDYMGQFCNGESSKKKGVQNGHIGKNSTKGRAKRKDVTVHEPSHASGDWVTPKTNSSLAGEESSKRRVTKNSNTKTMSKGKRKANKPDSSEILHTSASWMEPKDAGRRRVQAKGKSVGHWFTSNGRKVYVTKDGQELTGQSAYRQYRKDSGSGFKNSKKKTTGKKKTN